MTFIGKFRSDEVHGFHIDVKLCDGVSTLSVRIGDSPCRNFLRFNATEYLAWKREKEKYRDQLVTASKRLVDLNQMLMHVNAVFRLEKLPKTLENIENLEALVTELRDFRREDLQRLRNQVDWARKH